MQYIELHIYNWWKLNVTICCNCWESTCKRDIIMRERIIFNKGRCNINEYSFLILHRCLDTAIVILETYIICLTICGTKGHHVLSTNHHRHANACNSAVLVHTSKGCFIFSIVWSWFRTSLKVVCLDIFTCLMRVMTKITSICENTASWYIWDLTRFYIALLSNSISSLMRDSSSLLKSWLATFHTNTNVSGSRQNKNVLVL